MVIPTMRKHPGLTQSSEGICARVPGIRLHQQAPHPRQPLKQRLNRRERARPVLIPRGQQHRHAQPMRVRNRIHVAERCPSRGQSGALESVPNTRS